MFRLVAAQVRRRRGRALTVLAGIVAASVAFALLTATVATSQVRVKATVDENFRSAYDLLVRPPGSTTVEERSAGLVRPNFLSGIFGGITMNQYRLIEQMPGVDVAAPVAMIGYVLPGLDIPLTIDDLVADEAQVFRFESVWTTQRGLSRYPGADAYVYVTPRRIIDPADPFKLSYQVDPDTGEKIRVCDEFRANHSTELIPESPFDVANKRYLACFSSSSVPDFPVVSGLGRDQIGAAAYYPFPMLLAAVDPTKEAALVDLDDTMTSGRYLHASDQPTLVGPRRARSRSVPIIMADQTVLNQRLTVKAHRLNVDDPDQLTDRLRAENALEWLDSLSGPTVRSWDVHADPAYRELRDQYRAGDPVVTTAIKYWSADGVNYRTKPDGGLAPVRVDNPNSVWEDAFNTGFAPMPSGDVGFRKLQQHVGGNVFVKTERGEIMQSPSLREVGVFDPDRIRGFSELSRVPLTTYNLPQAEPADERSKKLLGDRPLLPGGNLAGYLQQPPLMLTNLDSLPAFTNPEWFTNTNPDKPLSVIRIRVSGVTGADEASQQRVRLLAERIIRETGLRVDVTIGSSPTTRIIDLPAGDYGRPALSLEEAWVDKGVGVELVTAVDRKSLTIFGLMLVVCLLFLVNSTVAAVRSRRTELGVLSCLGWPRRRIFALLEVEMLALGIIAGLVGTALAAGLVAVLDLTISWQLLAAITPVATLLAGLAAVLPAWQASHATPMEAIRPAGRAPKRAARVASIRRLALVGLARTPARTLLGAASLFVGVAGLAILIAIQLSFSGQAVGTLLGDAIAVQVRGVDYVAAGLTIGLGAFAVADITYLNITERADEIGTLHATGWTQRHVRRLFAIESVATATLGATAGAIVGTVVVAALFTASFSSTLTAAAAAALAGIVVGVAVTVPVLARASGLTPGDARANATA